MTVQCSCFFCEVNHTSAPLWERERQRERRGRDAISTPSKTLIGGEKCVRLRKWALARGSDDQVIILIRAADASAAAFERQDGAARNSWGGLLSDTTAFLSRELLSSIVHRAAAAPVFSHLYGIPEQFLA